MWCVYSSTDPTGWLLQMGMTRRNSAQPSSTQSRHIQAVVKHPDFNNASLYNNDIGRWIIRCLDFSHLTDASYPPQIVSAIRTRVFVVDFVFTSLREEQNQRFRSIVKNNDGTQTKRYHIMAILMIIIMIIRVAVRPTTLPVRVDLLQDVFRRFSRVSKTALTSWTSCPSVRSSCGRFLWGLRRDKLTNWP